MALLSAIDSLQIERIVQSSLPSMDQSNEYMNYEGTSDGYIPNNWEEGIDEADNLHQQDASLSDTISDQTNSLGFQQQPLPEEIYQYNNQTFPSEEINPEMDYETLIRTKDLYFDPDPQVLRKPASNNPVVYNQNIMVRFLQPPPISQGPLIIREVRPPQPPPPPPLVIRQRAPPPLSPPPIILRERPPPIPPILSTQVVTKSLPPLAPPPRSVIIEKLPALPSKPRDIIIERWIPYELSQRRRVIVQRAEGLKDYPRPRNIIIMYEPVQRRVIRQVERLGVTPEDPHQYASAYGNSLLETEQLLAQIRELGITEDLSPPHLFAHSQSTPITLDELNYEYNIAPQQQQQQQQQQQRPANYAPTYENLIQGQLSAINTDQPMGIDPLHGDELSAQLAHYGLTTESIPY